MQDNAEKRKGQQRTGEDKRFPEKVMAHFIAQYYFSMLIGHLEKLLFLVCLSHFQFQFYKSATLKTIITPFFIPDYRFFNRQSQKGRLPLSSLCLKESVATQIIG